MTGRVGRRMGVVLVAILALAGAIDGPGAAEEAAEETTEDKPKWSNATDLSIVVTEGNSTTSTIGFKNTLRRDWERAWFELKLDGVRSDTADDRFVLIDPNVTWLPGELPPPAAGTTISPSREADVERYFVEGKYGREITKSVEWNTGASWETNLDAGLLNRYIAFAGLGNIWADKEDLEFNTSYGLSFTYREEETPDPEKDDRFAGLRLSSHFLLGIGKTTTYKNEFTSNFNIADPGDYYLDMTNSLRVALSTHLALKVSLQSLFASEPALEEVDLKAFVILEDPDGVPGNGDEFFRTVSSGGAKLALGNTDIRKQGLDTIFRTSLVIKF
ncbi:MAG: DUF481 domain-containing protein [Acidobacteria bacterium]|nr:DUF481 domain-containing protein [Acidobacteriota bacterium]